MIAIIDFGAGNLRSVAKALAKIGYPTKVTSQPEEVLSAQVAILPGVGAAADAMQHLRATGMDEVVRRLIAEGRPLFGICLGLQVLFTGTEEGGSHECLGILPGQVKRLPTGLKVPHMGWNQVRQRGFHPLLAGIPDGSNFYFVHSYYVEPEEESIVWGTTDYGLSFPSLIMRGNLVATQFHPEKSGEMGLRLYHNFLRLHLGERR